MTLALYGTASLIVGTLINLTADLLPVLSRRIVKIEETWPVLDLQVGRQRRRWLLVLGAVVLVGALLVRLGASGAVEESILALSLYFAIFLLIVVIDLEHRRVPNAVVYPSAVVGLLIVAFFPGVAPTASLGGALGGGVAGFLIFLVVATARPGAMGMGDVKLAGLIGVFVGYPDVLSALVVGILCGGVAAFAGIASGRISRKSTMAYAPYLVAGGAYVLLVQARLLGDWLSLLSFWM